MRSELYIYTPVILSIICVLLGYWMGRNSAERPMISEAQQRPFDPGSTDEPDHDDIFRDAMSDPEQVMDTIRR